MMSSHLIIGTRGSLLALTQTRLIEASLRQIFPALTFEMKIIKTTGDRITDVALSRIGDRGLFTRDLEDALLSGEVDLAVHSLKDLSSELPSGLCLAAVPERAEPWDVLITRQLPTGEDPIPLPGGAAVGSSSLRRRAQLRHHRPDLDILDVRGNLDTRLRKLDDGRYDALALAAAGLIRLGWSERIACRLPADVCLPAVGQGALGLEARSGDEAVLRYLSALEHPPSRQAVAAERAFLRVLEGGCQVPAGALGEVGGSQLRLQGMAALPDGSLLVRREETGPASDPESLGEHLASQILQNGGQEILAEVRHG
ncbi:MAG: hydroxymethylbilane synthase [Armatimonadetes bacterium]|nr:hydroxymethylbilane synthase [Armatimonadota bacterium]